MISVLILKIVISLDNNIYLAFLNLIKHITYLKKLLVFPKLGL
jgi:hypothetical protein